LNTGRNRLQERIFLRAQREALADDSERAVLRDGRFEFKEHVPFPQDCQQHRISGVRLQVLAVARKVETRNVVDGYDLVSLPQLCDGRVYDAVDQKGDAGQEEIFVSLLLAHRDQLVEREDQFHLPSVAFDHDAAVAFGDDQRVYDLVDVVRLFAVDAHQPVSVVESEFVPGLVEVVAPLGVGVREIGVAPRVADADVDGHGQHDVHHHAGDHHQKTLPGGFGAELVLFDGLFHLFRVHRLVDHAGDLDISAQRQPSQTVLGVSAFEFEQREPRVEEDVEFLDADFEHPRHDEVTHLVNAYQDGEAEEELNDFYKNVHKL